MATKRMEPGRRVAVVDGLRTPFVKSGTLYRDLTALDLAKAVVNELVARSEIPVQEIDALIFGQVVPSLAGPNVGREVVLNAQLPKTLPAHSVSQACITSIRSATEAAESIRGGTAEVIIAGGTESLTDIPMTVSRTLAQALMAATKAKTVSEKLRAFRGVGGRDLLPVPPALREATTGLTMGESAEKMVKENGISRDAQDLFAHQSHTRASKAWADGKFNDEVMRLPLPPQFGETVVKDNTIRDDSDLAAYANLKPVFDRKYGTITAGNSSPLTDGAAALLLMSEERAKALGYMPLGYLRAWAYAAVDPSGQLLIGPAYATPLALDRAGLKLADMDLIDFHEAFAGQVLSVTQAFGSKKFAEEKLGRSEAIGEVDPAKMNVNGGSIALGHPFGATGARMISQNLRELRRRNGQLALITLCAAGGMGAAVVLERA
jgi:acetyl-CoA acyltransferase